MEYKDLVEKDWPDTHINEKHLVENPSLFRFKTKDEYEAFRLDVLDDKNLP